MNVTVKIGHFILTVDYHSGSIPQTVDAILSRFKFIDTLSNYINKLVKLCIQRVTL